MSGIQLKQAVTSALEANDFDAVLARALADRKVLSTLVRLAYRKDTLVGWRAIIAIGRISAIYVRSNADYLRETIRKLLWSLTDESGGIGWAAPEILGEIVSADPKKMADIIPLIAEVFAIEEKVFRPGVLYALKRIAEKNPEAVRDFEDLIEQGLSDEEPLSRAYALQFAELLYSKDEPRSKDAVKTGIKRLFHDKSEVWIYKDSGFTGVLIGELAFSAYDTIFSK